ncbi:MAG: zinc-dependent metalloprotease [bacterium]
MIRATLRRLPAQVGLGVAILASATLIGGCAEERPIIDRVQPNVLSKSMFHGEWYYVRTVVDVPAANGFTHVGDTDHSGMKKITWDIQEDYLYARRSTELIEGGDAKDEEGEGYKGEVVAAYRIQSHFDIVNAYNPTTGEQLNIREENTRDRPWYAREYIRVDWSTNLVHNYTLSFEAASVEPVPYYVQEIDPATGERNVDAPYFEADGSYFDITNKLYAKAGTTEYPGYGTIPLCWLFGNEFDECGAGEFTIRNSFKKIDPTHQYELLPYKGKQTEVFGFFTTDRLVYDDHNGIREQTKKRFLNRHNLWKKWWDDNGDPIPYAERELRPIVYHVNTDFPEDLKPVARDVAAQWDGVFTDAVKALGHDPKGPAFILCENNPVREGDPAECGAPGTVARLGDIRYSFMAYIPKYMTYGLLGLGPSNNDPETGEIISGMGYVYHHNNTAAYQVQEMIELLNGDRDPTDYINGLDLAGWRDAVNSDPGALSQTYGLDEAGYMVEQIANGPAARFWQGRRYPITPADEQFQAQHGVEKWIKPFFDDMYRQGLANGERSGSTGRLAQVAGTYIEDLLVDDELLAATGHDPSMPLTDDIMDRVSVARGGLGQFMKDRARIREELAARHNKYLPEMADDALMGLARDLQGKPPEEVYEAARRAIYTAVLAHEVGHSLGLMHNFGGSDDAINYHDDYWHIRDDGNVGPRTDVDPITTEEIDAKLYNHAYSSVMDYAGRYTIDGRGIGKYDRAAILFGYAGKVEVFEDTAGVDPSWFTQWFETDGDVIFFRGNGPEAVHYTTFYNRMGDRLYAEDNRRLVDVADVSADFSTATVDGETKIRVPYIYCSHSRANLSDSCLTRDFGADPAERMKNIIDELNTWYIQRSFPRGSISSTHFNYVERWYGRIYDRLKKWHDIYGLYNALLPQFYSPEVMQRFLTEPTTGWGGKTWAVQNAFNYLVQTVMMPDIGGYRMVTQTPDGYGMVIKSPSLVSPLELDVTNGRYFSTDWGFNVDGRECGYFWHECLHHVGFYLDKIMAIEALSDSETNFVARSSPEDLREWEVSYYSTFPRQISKISAALTDGDFREVGPYLDGDGVMRFPNYAGALEAKHDMPVDPYATFTVQLYWQVMGQARFFENYDQSFRDESRIFVLGTGEAPNVDPNRMITFTDPTSGMVYGALRYADRVGAGQGVLERAWRLMRNSDMCDEDGLTETDADDCTAGFNASLRATAGASLYDHIELIKIMADLSPMMNFGNPYSP